MTVKLVDRLLQIFFPGLIIGTLLVQMAPPLLDSAEQYYPRKSLDADVSAFYAAVQTAYAMAMQTHQRLGVEVLPTEWVIYRDVGLAWQQDEQDEVIARGTWSEGLKFGSTLPHHRFFITADGRCHINRSIACIESEQSSIEGISSFSFTSNARSIYTLYFENNQPKLIHDNY